LEPPKGIVVDEAHTTSIKVTWSRPVAYGALCPLDNYNISWTPIDNSDAEGGSTVIQDENHEIRDLIPCTNYSINVQAINIAGSSNAATVNVSTQNEVLEPPKGIVVDEAHTTSIKVTWSRPVAYGALCPLDNYNISWTPIDNSDAEGGSTVIQDENHEIRDLIPCTNYSINVQAINIAGSSNAATVNVSTQNEGDFNENETQTTSIKVTWSRPTEHGPLCPLEKYNILWVPNDGEGSAELGPKEEVYNITNLVPCTAYTIHIQALNTAGSSITTITDVQTVTENKLFLKGIFA
ncbi:hypothetical protein SK128_000630, partial [Halocaridina rubra]